MKLPLDRRPVMVVIAGPNGAGKTTFFHAHLASTGLRFVNADVLARELKIDDPYAAARSADALRRQLVREGESFIFETVFSDRKGDKLAFLEEAMAGGYNVVLCFIGVATAMTSEYRVAMRVSQGGHDVPADKLIARYPRTMTNLRAAVRVLPHAWVFDNEDLCSPYRRVAVFAEGKALWTAKSLPAWLRQMI